MSKITLILLVALFAVAIAYPSDVDVKDPDVRVVREAEAEPEAEAEAAKHNKGHNNGHHQHHYPQQHHYPPHGHNNGHRYGRDVSNVPEPPKIAV